MIDDDKIFDVAEAARYLRVSEQTVYKLCRRGDISAAKVGREWRIHKPAVLDFLHTGNGPKQKEDKRRRKGDL